MIILFFAVRFCLGQTAEQRLLNGAPSARSESSLRRSIDKDIDPYVKSASFTGEVLVSRKGTTLFDRGYGLAARRQARPISAGTRFYIASLSKSFTAAAILLLEEQGKLKVSDKVSSILPGLPNADRLTIQELLTHTSGIPDELRAKDFIDVAKQHYSIEKAVELFIRRPLEFEPGSRQSYSNSNYVLLAYMIEKISGSSYIDFLRRNFFVPLRMKDTGEEEGFSSTIGRFAEGYDVTGLYDFQDARYYDRSIIVGAGSLYSTPSDLSKWMEGLFSGKILKRPSVAAMYEGQNSYVGHVAKILGRDAVIENGWDGAAYAVTVIHFLNENVTIVVQSNLNIASVTGEIANLVSAAYFNEKADTLTVDTDPIDDRSLKKLVGRYKLGNDFYVPGTVLEIVAKDGHLFELQHNPQKLVGLIRLENGDFIHRSSWARVHFETDPTGQATGLLFYGRFKAARLSD